MFVVCEKWVETRTDCYIDPSSSLDHSSTSFASWLGLLNWGSLRAQSPLSAVGSHFGILSPTDSNHLGTWLYYFLMPAVLLLIYTGASLDWRLGRGSIYNNKSMSEIENFGQTSEAHEIWGCWRKMTKFLLIKESVTSKCTMKSSSNQDLPTK